jgi:hypothetical protein
MDNTAMTRATTPAALEDRRQILLTSTYPFLSLCVYWQAR